MLHNIVQFVLASSLLFAVPRLRPTGKITLKQFSVKAIPCGITTAFDIGLSNSSLKTVSLTLYTMIKSGVPVFVLGFSFLLGLEKPSWKLAGVIALICLGVLIMVLGDTKFDAVGYAQVQTATVFSGLRWALTQILLKKNGVALTNPFAVIQLISPVIASTLLLFFLYSEGVNELYLKLHTVDNPVFLLSCIAIGGCLAFAMQVVEFTLVEETSVLTLSVAGIFKEIVTISTSILIFDDDFNLHMLLGLIVSLVGIIAYNYVRIYGVKQSFDTEYVDLSYLEVSSDEDLVANMPPISAEVNNRL